MKKYYFVSIVFICTTFCFGQTIFINEIHYDNNGADTNEGVEIAGPANTDLLGYKIYFYNGNGSIYGSILHLSGIIPNQLNNRGTLWFEKADFQNGSPDGLALLDDSNTVIQFLSYEGIITAVAGPANAMTSIDIGVSESNSTPVGYSLQLIGSGSNYSDFFWDGPLIATPGLPNTGQTLSIVKNQIEKFSMYPNPIVNGNFLITTSSRLDKQVEIYSLVGEKVYTKKVKANEKINVSNLNAGLYMLKVEEEGKIATRKLLIK